MKNKHSNFVLALIHKLKRSRKRADEGGIFIRYTRLKKFKKQGKKLAIASQIVAIWYLSVLSISYLTSDTGAYFNDIEIIENSLHANWDNPDDGSWGKSSLKEAGQGGSCEGIYAIFTNTGESVDHELTKYEIYYSETDGNIKDGEVVKEGTFPIPDKGETYKIEYQQTQNGYYRFKAYHETGHGNKEGSSDKGPWSEKIHITDCKVEKTSSDNNNENPESEDQETSTEDKNTESEDKGTSTEGKNIESSEPTEQETSSDETDEAVEETAPEKVEDDVQPLDVTNLNGSKEGDSGKISLSWVNPDYPGFNKVKIYHVKSESEINLIGEVSADATKFNYRFETSEKSSSYQIKVTTIKVLDGIETESVGTSQSIK